MKELVPACHVGSISAFEQTKIASALRGALYGKTDQWFIVPVCTPCFRRFLALNDMKEEPQPEFEFL